MKDAFGQALGYARSFDRLDRSSSSCDIGHASTYTRLLTEPELSRVPQRPDQPDLSCAIWPSTDTLRRVFEDRWPSIIQALGQDHARVAAASRPWQEAGRRRARSRADRAVPHALPCSPMFAEDVGLLPEGLFTRALKELWLPHPASFPGGVEDLWRKMNDGGEMFGVVGKILRFNGGLFANPRRSSWTRRPLRSCCRRRVQLVRRRARHLRHPAGTRPGSQRAPRTGRPFHPRAYVERLVRPTIEEPLRATGTWCRSRCAGLLSPPNTPRPTRHPRTNSRKPWPWCASSTRSCATRAWLESRLRLGNFLYVTLESVQAPGRRGG